MPTNTTAPPLSCWKAFFSELYAAARELDARDKGEPTPLNGKTPADR